jgi:hypothetical protein
MRGKASDESASPWSVATDGRTRVLPVKRKVSALSKLACILAAGSLAFSVLMVAPKMMLAQKIEEKLNALRLCMSKTNVPLSYFVERSRRCFGYLAWRLVAES